MEKPEWKKAVEGCNSAISQCNSAITQCNSNITQCNSAVNTHTTAANIHRKIYVSTAEPTASDGANGDIWIVYA